MKSLNWTNVIVTITLFVVAWLFIPSPFHKCPVSTHTIDTVLVSATTDSVNHLAVSSNEIHPVAYEHFEIHEDSTDSVYTVDMLTFSKESVVTVPADSIGIWQDTTLIGYLTLGEVIAHFRSTTFYQIGDSLAQTMHEISIPARPTSLAIKPITVNHDLIQPVNILDKPVAILESPVTWGLIGIIIGAVATAIFVNNIKEKNG